MKKPMVIEARLDGLGKNESGRLCGTKPPYALEVIADAEFAGMCSILIAAALWMSSYPPLQASH